MKPRTPRPPKTTYCKACGGEGWLPSLPEGHSECPACDGTGQSSPLPPKTSETLMLRPSQFQHGDLLVVNNTTVIGKTYVRGGVRVDVRNADGTTSSRLMSGRSTYQIARDQKS